MLDVGLLTLLSRPLKIDVHGSFHSIDIELMVGIFFSAAYSAEHLNIVYSNPFCGSIHSLKIPIVRI
jgi:hypothetical protein